MMNKAEKIVADSAGDLVLREIRRAKDALSASTGYDLEKFFAGLREREKHSGHPIVPLRPKPE